MNRTANTPRDLPAGGEIRPLSRGESAVLTASIVRTSEGCVHGSIPSL
ncbi:MAG: hypothetical protein WD035_01735 [Balneolaceae bacterium]